MDAQEEVQDLLRSSGGYVRKGKKHKVWVLADGRKWTTPSTPSDTHAWKNNLADLRRFLGLCKPFAEGIRRERRVKQRQKAVPFQSVKPTSSRAGKTLHQQLLERKMTDARGT